jgi:hypothetical protein
MMKDVSNGQRALWMTLVTSLAAPFLASLIVVAIMLTGPLADYVLPPRGQAPLGDVAISAFAWSSLPATVAAFGLIPFVLQHGSYTWLQAAVAGVLGFVAGAIIFPLADGGAPPVLAFLAGLLAIVMRAMLIGGGVLRETPDP